MTTTPIPESDSDMHVKLDNKPTRMLFSCLQVLGKIFVALLVMFVAFYGMIFLAVYVFFGGIAPKQKDIEHATELIQQVQERMDNFEQSLQPIQERIEKLEQQFPKQELPDMK